MNGRPAVALTTDRLFEVMSEITNTPRDTPETVSIPNLISAAEALNGLLKLLADRL